ncbi:MAG: hypothetical protein ACLGG9_11330 [Thermoleophilia bacterium]|jgi:hypothetical protein
MKVGQAMAGEVACARPDVAMVTVRAGVAAERERPGAVRGRTMSRGE